MLLLFAGFDTTGNTLSVTTYHLLSNPDKLERVRKEIEPLMLENDGKPTWPDLEKLPYLVNLCPLLVAALNVCPLIQAL
jgi:cytochrome P450